MNVVSLGFRTDLMLLELGGSVSVDHPTHRVVRTPADPRHRWGNFLLLASPPREGEAAAWRAEFGRHFPEAGHLAIGVDGTDGEAGATGALSRLGVTARVDSVLTADGMPAPGRDPAGVDVRPLHGAEDWAQAAELRLAGVGNGPPGAARRADVETQQATYRRLCEEGYGSWFGAFVDGRMRAGGGLFTDGGGTARYQQVATHPHFLRRGLATSVIRHAGHWARTQLRVRTLVLVTDPAHHAAALCRNLGFVEAERQVRLEGET